MESYLRPYVCVECQRRFTNKLFLKRHSAVHSSTRNYQCIACPSTYKYKKGLNRHLKKFHPDYYNTFNLTPFKKIVTVKVEESDLDSGESSEKSVKSENTSSKSSSSLKESPETRPILQDSIVDIAKPQVIHLERREPLPAQFLPTFIPLKAFQPEDIHKASKSNLQLAQNTINKPSADSWKDFSKVIFSNLFSIPSKIYNTSSNNRNNSEGMLKGFIPVNEEKIGREVNANKRIEYLEETIRNLKFKEASMSFELEKEKKKTLELEKELSEFKEIYKINVWDKYPLRKKAKIEKVEDANCEVESKISG